jgi:hypothetical protein
MARVYITAGSYSRPNPDLHEVIDHESADEAAIQELLKRLRQRGTVGAEDEHQFRILVCYERHSNRPPTFCPKDIHFKITIGRREYRIYATPKPLRRNVIPLTGGKAAVDEMLDEMPDLHLLARARHPDGKFDHASSIEVSTEVFS